MVGSMINLVHMTDGEMKVAMMRHFMCMGR